MQTKIETTTKTVNKGTEWVRSSVFIPAHNVMDFLENKLESVMLKPSSGMILKSSLHFILVNPISGYKKEYL